MSDTMARRFAEMDRAYLTARIAERVRWAQDMEDRAAELEAEAAELRAEAEATRQHAQELTAKRQRLEAS